MVKCKWCNQEMADEKTTSCDESAVVDFGKEVMKPIVFVASYEGERCHDCNIADGGIHHPGCDMERCPKCGGQLISCGCLSD